MSLNQLEEINPLTTPDTIFPGSYLPWYPGSWWTYRLPDSSTLTVRIDSNYRLDSFQLGDLTYSTPTYVPSNGTISLYGHQVPRASSIDWPGNSLYDYIRTDVGTDYQWRLCDSRYNYCSYKRVESLELINGDSVLTIMTYPGHSLGYPALNEREFSVYVKDIGLVASYEINVQTQDTLDFLILTDHFINN